MSRSVDGRYGSIGQRSPSSVSSPSPSPRKRQSSILASPSVSNNATLPVNSNTSYSSGKEPPRSLSTSASPSLRGSASSVHIQAGNTSSLTAPESNLGDSNNVTSKATERCQVTLRIRPFNDTEIRTGMGETVWAFEKNRVFFDPVYFDERRRGSIFSEFVLDSVQTGSDNRSLYETTAKTVVISAMKGINGTILAYGQTASGKTFTMMGTPEHPGVIPQAVEEVFNYIRDQSQDREYLLRVSYMEIYNETIRDLLAPEQMAELRILEDRKRGVYVSPLKEEVITTPVQLMRIIGRGESNRTYGTTDYNERSSRSHTMFQLIIESRERSTYPDGSLNPHANLGVLISQLNLIDLAGSEKATTDMDRRKEGSFINRSLLVLGNVISKLVEIPPGFIPFRESKLTRILQTSLSGNSKIAIICLISPTEPNVDESLNTLKFATRVKKIAIKTTPNYVVDDKALIERYRQEIDELKTQLEMANELLEIERQQNTQAQASEAAALGEAERAHYEQQLQESLKARNMLKERIDHLTARILNVSSAGVPLPREKLLDSAMGGSKSNSLANFSTSARGSQLLYGAQTTDVQTIPGLVHSSQAELAFMADANRDKRVQGLEALVANINSVTNEPAVLELLVGYEQNNADSLNSFKALKEELDKMAREFQEMEIVCHEQMEEIERLKEGQSKHHHPSAAPSPTFAQTETLKSTIKQQQRKINELERTIEELTEMRDRMGELFIQSPIDQLNRVTATTFPMQ